MDGCLVCGGVGHDGVGGDRIVDTCITFERGQWRLTHHLTQGYEYHSSWERQGGVVLIDRNRTCTEMANRNSSCTASEMVEENGQVSENVINFKYLTM